MLGVLCPWTCQKRLKSAAPTTLGYCLATAKTKHTSRRTRPSYCATEPSHQDSPSFVTRYQPSATHTSTWASQPQPTACKAAPTVSYHQSAPSSASTSAAASTLVATVFVSSTLRQHISHPPSAKKLLEVIDGAVTVYLGFQFGVFQASVEFG